MTKEQAVFIVKKLVSFYPNWKVDRDIIGFWVDRLQQEDYENVTANVDEYTTSSEYPPSIAAIIKPNSRIEGRREIERTRQKLQEQEEIRNSIPRELPWVREGISREEWTNKVIAEKAKEEGKKWNTSA